MTNAHDPSNAIVDVDFRKWPDKPHWRFDTQPLGIDEHGTWLAAPAGTSYTGPRGAGTWPYGFVVLVCSGDWWMGAFYDEGDVEVYTDVLTPARWVTDGHVTAIDLDLDVERTRDGRVKLLDEDEFEEHRTVLGYPDDIVEQSLRTARELVRAVEAHREPFAKASAHWLAAMRRMALEQRS